MTSGIQELAALEQAGALTDAGLVITVEMTYERYEALAAHLGSLHRRSAWAIGDLFAYGEKVFGEAYVQAADATGLAEQTVRNYASVAARVPRQRRRPLLPFSMHETVAKLEPEQQEMWLEKADRERWTREQLRLAVKGPTRALNGAEVLPPPTVSEVCQCCGRPT